VTLRPAVRSAVLLLVAALVVSCGTEAESGDAGTPSSTGHTSDAAASTSTTAATTTSVEPVESIDGVPVGVVQVVGPPPPLVEPVVPDQPDEPASVLSAAARTTLGTQWSAEVVLEAGQDTTSTLATAGTGHAWHGPYGRLDVHWSDGTLDAWADRESHNVDPFVGMLLRLERGAPPGTAAPTSQSDPSTFSVGAASYCHGRFTQDPTIPTNEAVMCGPIRALVEGGRVVEASAWEADQGAEPWSSGAAPKVSLRLDDDPDMSLRPSASAAHPTCVISLTLSSDLAPGEAERRVEMLRLAADRWQHLQVVWGSDLPEEGIGVDPGCPDPASPLGPHGWVVRRSE